MIFQHDNRKHVDMTFHPSNERGRDRTDYHAGRIFIPHRHGLATDFNRRPIISSLSAHRHSYERPFSSYR